MRVDDPDRLPFGQTDCAATSCRYNLKLCRHIPVPLPLARCYSCLVKNSFIDIGGRVKAHPSRGPQLEILRLSSTARFPVAILHRRTATSQQTGFSATAKQPPLVGSAPVLDSATMPNPSIMSRLAAINCFYRRS